MPSNGHHARSADRWASFSRGWLGMLLDRTNIVVTSLTALVILYTRSAGVAYFAAGATACALSVKLVIKRVVRQPRPTHLVSSKSKPKKTYGMPSTHSAAITYFAVYIPLACAYLPRHPSLPDSDWTRALPPLIVVPWAAAIVYSRIWLGHHTWPQCLAGCVYGAAFSFAWYTLWTNGLDSYGQLVESRLHDILGF